MDVQVRKSAKRTKKNGGGRKGKKRRISGPHLPNTLRKAIEHINEKSNGRLDSEGDEEIDSDEGNGDVYEYEEGIPEEESRKNARFDRVENYEYELPENFEDEDVQSDDGDDDEVSKNSDDEDKTEDEEDDDEERHSRMLQAITGMPTAASKGKKNSKPVFISEVYPESEFNPTRDVLEGDGRITIEDLLEPLQGNSAFSEIRKRISGMKKDSISLSAPLPKPERERLERKAVKELVAKEFNKWVPLVKKNREAPTVYFNQDVDVGISTVGAIASEFEPRTEFEKKMASVLHDDKVLEAHKEDGALLLEMNEMSVEDHIKDRDHIAKMRSLLFRHELKSKRIKKIKSKTYHRLKNKDKMKSAVDMLMDPEIAKEEAMKQDFKRAEERMTLRHKNKSKWAKRMIDRGLNVRDEGTRAAIAEQLQMNTNLTRKMNSMKDESSSDESDDEEEFNDGLDEDNVSKLLAKAEEKTLKAVEDEGELPASGVMSLPFMVRAMKKRNDEAVEEAKHALEVYGELKSADGAENAEKSMTVSGRRVFGAAGRKEAPKELKKKESDNFYDTSDSENDVDDKEDAANFGVERDDALEKEADIDEVLPAGNTEKFGDDVGNPASKTTFDVAIFASGSWKKVKNGKKADAANNKQPSKKTVRALQGQDKEEASDEESGDSDTEMGQMVDGVMSSVREDKYELPSQAELMRHGFAGDDVADEFEKDKLEILNEENPEPEKPILIPGWGQWAHIQQKKGLPSWMLKEHEDAKKKRDQALKSRKDARLKHVIISEKIDKKAEKLHTKALPFPYTSKEVFEQSIRVPIGPEFNPATTIGALNRPEVVKKPGVMINPVKYEEVNPHEKDDDRRPRNKQKQKPVKGKSGRGKNKAKSK
ncbi:PREDICTED: uncharacterized protein C57A7.06 [Tarenaya hassleriana]|uniref:uncharacterized protein C57A7.06 n=1 Tax=Tarenaya hassleriana TaxID=28532 RepID=UPI00053C6C46|nr:PREDICTED: uncharacterized protein C57A7.06 [Tarenaya hassleriana]